MQSGAVQALIDSAHEERFRVLSEAAAAHKRLDQKLTAVLNALFGFIRTHRELVRLAFASAFAAPGEPPPGLSYKDKCQRNFGFLHELMKEGQISGELSADFGAGEIAMHWHGLMNIYVMGQLYQPDVSYDERTARSTVELFFRGAGARRRKKGPVHPARQDAPESSRRICGF